MERLPKADLSSPVILSPQGTRRLLAGQSCTGGGAPSSAQPSLLPQRRVSPAWPEDQDDSSPQLACCLFPLPWLCGHWAGCPSPRDHPVSWWETVVLRGGETHPKLLPEERTCLARLCLLPSCPSLLCLHLARRFPGALADALTPAHHGI